MNKEELYEAVRDLNDFLIDVLREEDLTIAVALLRDVFMAAGIVEE